METEEIKTEIKPRMIGRGIICAGAVVLAVIAALAFTLFGHAAKYTDYTVNYRGKTFTARIEGDSAAALESVGIAAEDVEYDSTITDDSSVTIDVFDRYIVSVICDGEQKFITVRDGTAVKDAVAELGIVLDGDDRLEPSGETPAEDGMEVVATRIETEYTEVQLPIDFETSRVANDSMYKGEEKVTVNGAEGIKIITYRSTMADGVLESFDKDKEEVTKEPVTKVVEYGTKEKPEPKPETKKTDSKTTKKTDPKSTTKTTTKTTAKTTTKTTTKTSSDPEINEQSMKTPSKPSYTSGKSDKFHDDGNGTVTTYSGKVLKYSKVVELKATAYTYSSIKKYNTTASGVPVQVGVVAAHKNTLKMGTKVYIVSSSGTWEYGVATVGDTGCGAGKVDLFMESYNECINFGVRGAKVYILE